MTKRHFCAIICIIILKNLNIPNTNIDALKASGFCTNCGNKTPCDCAPKTKEIRGDFGAIIEEGKNRALDSIREKYEDRPNKKDNLPFHNVEHSKGVVDNVEKILKAIQEASPDLVSDHDVEIGRLAAAYHDTVQEQEKGNKVVQEGEFVKVIRKRLTGSNEKKSGEEAEKFMNEANQNGAVFSEHDIQTVKRAIDTTVPDWDPVNKTVEQKNLNDKSSLVERALALADLATAGMEGADRFLVEGPAIFREENLDIWDAIYSGENIPQNKQDYFKKRMIDWLKFQPNFARGRQARLKEELRAIPEPARTAVAELFDQFEDSIQKSQEVADGAEKMSFEELKETMGYKRSFSKTLDKFDKIRDDNYADFHEMRKDVVDVIKHWDDSQSIRDMYSGWTREDFKKLLKELGEPYVEEERMFNQNPPKEAQKDKKQEKLSGLFSLLEIKEKDLEHALMMAEPRSYEYKTLEEGLIELNNTLASYKSSLQEMGVKEKGGLFEKISTMFNREKREKIEWLRNGIKNAERMIVSYTSEIKRVPLEVRKGIVQKEKDAKNNKVKKLKDEVDTIKKQIAELKK